MGQYHGGIIIYNGLVLRGVISRSRLEIYRKLCACLSLYQSFGNKCLSPIINMRNIANHLQQNTFENNFRLECVPYDAHC